jgi:hypothetical protein
MKIYDIDHVMKALDVYQEGIPVADDSRYDMYERLVFSLLAHDIPETLAFLRRADGRDLLNSFCALPDLLVLTGRQDILDAYKEAAARISPQPEFIPATLKQAEETAIAVGRKDIQKESGRSPIATLRSFLAKERLYETAYFRPQYGRYYFPKIRLMSQDPERTVAFIRTASPSELIKTVPVLPELLWITRNIAIEEAFFAARSSIGQADRDEYCFAIEEAFASFRIGGAPTPGALNRMKQDLSSLFRLEDSESSLSDEDRELLLLAEEGSFCQDLPSAIAYLDEAPREHAERCFRFFNEAIAESGDQALLEAFSRVCERAPESKKGAMREKLKRGNALLAEGKVMRERENDDSWSHAAETWPVKKLPDDPVLGKDPAPRRACIWAFSRYPLDLAEQFARGKTRDSMLYLEILPAVLFRSHSVFLWEKFIALQKRASDNEQRATLRALEARIRKAFAWMGCHDFE